MRAPCRLARGKATKSALQLCLYEDPEVQVGTQRLGSQLTLIGVFRVQSLGFRELKIQGSGVRVRV